MKRRFFVLAVVVCCMAVGLTACGNTDPSDKSGLDAISAAVETWEMPEAFGRNTDFKVEVSADGKTWKALPVCNVENGHQSATDPLLAAAGIEYSGTPYIASLAMFDFTGTVGLRVTYNKGNLSEGGYVIGPDSYGIKSVQNGNVVTFTLKQNSDSPRKVVFRPAGEWEAKTLHIMTNVPEGAAAVNKATENVLSISPGDEIPLRLPEGKTTYYFEPGMHSLPGGYWADIDLGEVRAVKNFSIIVPSRTPGGLCFELLAKASDSENYQTVYKSVGADAKNNTGTVTGALSGISARYFRLLLHGNYNATINAVTRYIHTAYVRELFLTDAGGVNLALGKAVDGAGEYALLTDGRDDTGDYGHDYAGETFSAFSDATYYFAKGAVVSGSIIADDASDITVAGRGILDGSKLVSENRYNEGRNGGIRFLNCKDIDISGITVLNIPMWMVVVNFSENVRVSGLNLFGSVVNADGIHFSATKNAVATGCFIRTTDDLFVAYHYGDTQGLEFKNCVLWTDGGRVLLLGLDATGDIRDVVMRNCDIITFQNVHDLSEHGGLVHIVATNGRTIENVLVKDIRIDKLRAPSIAQLAQLRTGNQLYSAGFIKGVTLENIASAGRIPPKSLVSKVMPGGGIEDITVKNVSFAGVKVTAQNLSSYFNCDADIAVSVS